jgi:hypothetical protein
MSFLALAKKDAEIKRQHDYKAKRHILRLIDYTRSSIAVDIGYIAFQRRVPLGRLKKHV